MVNLKRLSILSLLFIALFSYGALAYTGVLDSFQGWDFSTAGAFAVDDFDLSDSDIYVEIRIDDAQTWLDGGTSGMYVTAYKKNILGSYVNQQTNSFTKSPYDTSYSTLSFTGLSSGNYKMRFAAYFADSVDFTGVVWDDQ